MRLHHLALLVFASAGIAQIKPIVTQPTLPCDVPNSQVSMCVTSAIGSCGYICQPFDCTPNYTLINTNENVRFTIGGTPAEVYVLFSGAAVPGCQPIAGFEGKIGLWADIFTVAIGMVNDAMPPGGSTCESGSAFFDTRIPGNMPLGTDVRFQVLGINTFCRSAPTPAFSRATEIRTR